MKFKIFNKKNIINTVVVVGILGIMAGCSAPELRKDNKTNLSSSGQNKVESSTNKADGAKEKQSQSVKNKPNKNAKAVDKNFKKNEKDETCDLTSMGKDMMYATAYQMSLDPNSFDGKTIKVKGNFYSQEDDKDGTVYKFCIVKDDQGCCSQGIEFQWADGVNPPVGENDEMTITGEFHAYKSEDGSQVYGRIENAKPEEAK